MTKRLMNLDQVAMDSNFSIANVLMLLSRGRSHGHGHVEEISSDQRRVFECKTCNRQFSSFQALGGHRASHKKLRLSDENQVDRTQSAVTKPKVHECSICGLKFANGQALGGHMRRHRGVVSDHGFGHGIAMEKMIKRCSDDDGGHEKTIHGVLDLNLPPLDDEMECKKLGLGLDLGMAC